MNRQYQHFFNPRQALTNIDFFYMVVTMMEEEIPNLFAANIHSEWKIQTTPVTDPNILATLDAISRIFLPQTSFGAIVTADRIDEGVNSQSYRIVRSVSNREPESLLLRSNNPITTRQELERVAALMHYLHRDAAIPVPAFFAPFVVERDGMLWQGGPFIDGNHFHGTELELRHAAATIARHHHALRAYPHAGDFPPTSFGSMDRSVWDATLRSIPESRVAQLLASHRDRLPSVVISLQAFLATADPEVVAQQIIHADLHPQNLIMRDEQVAAIIDFGNASYGSLGIDVGNACHRLVRQYIVHQIATRGGSWQTHLPTGIRAFIEAYQQADPSFTNEQVRALPYFMREMLLRKIGFCILAVPSGRYSDEAAANHIQRFIAMLEEVDAIERAIQKSPE